MQLQFVILQPSASCEVNLQVHCVTTVETTYTLLVAF